MYNIIFTQRAIKDINKIETTSKERIINKLKEYSTNPFLYAVKLSNKKIGDYRFRIGDFRVVFDIDKDKIIILRIGHRKHIY